MTTAHSDSSAVVEQITEGDRVEADIESPANPFGSTQTGTFDVTRVDGDTVEGVDPNWGDDVEIVCDGVPHYTDFGKSGDCVEIRVMETRDGVTIYGTGTVVYEA